MTTNSMPAVKIHICTPTHNGSLAIEYTNSILSLQKMLDQKEITYNIIFDQSSLLHTSRNFMASLCCFFSDVTHVLFVDSDMGFSAETVIKLIEADLDVIGAVYPYKLLPMNHQLQDASETESLGEWIARHLKYAVRGPARSKSVDIYEFESIGTGLLLISKSALKRLVDGNHVKIQNTEFTSLVFS